MKAKCCICKGSKDNMRAYVPTKVIKGTRVVLGKPGFICMECLSNKRKVSV